MNDDKKNNEISKQKKNEKQISTEQQKQWKNNVGRGKDITFFFEKKETKQKRCENRLKRRIEF